MTTNSELLINSAHGIYVAQTFAQYYYETESIKNEAELSNELCTLLGGPDKEYYWEAWETVLNNAIMQSPSEKEFILWSNDGDIWAVPVDEIELIPEY